MKKIVFKLNTGVGVNDYVDAEIEVDDNESEESIGKMFSDWVWEQLDCTWYEKK